MDQYNYSRGRGEPGQAVWYVTTLDCKYSGDDRGTPDGFLVLIDRVWSEGHEPGDEQTGSLTRVYLPLNDLEELRRAAVRLYAVLNHDLGAFTLEEPTGMIYYSAGTPGVFRFLDTFIGRDFYWPCPPMEEA